ncbi:restriction endonuclease subunit S [Streptomyces luteolus]|uniref:Restriction endonuclease subunit S n=1 Tax=Streptomyces luteolus TaxID=3043615 RepID=A0ABT6SSW7_9ACTN|nr:restriction endonuclease subunit S [Streptomyces sp. B-S-A12]MDI3418694.1 restriction endonuclease subunit S [Streptomyces sp. B-S-A12]
MRRSVKLKYCLRSSDSGTWGDEADGVDAVPVLRSTEISLDGSVDSREPALRSLSRREEARTRLHEGDILVVRSSGSDLHLGKSGYVDGAASGMSFSNFLQRLRVEGTHSPRFVWYFLNSSDAKQQIRKLSSTTTGLQNLSAALIAELQIATPSPGEQRRIADFLDAATARIDELTALRRRQAVLLRERADRKLAGLFSDTAGRRQFRLRHLMRSNPCYGVLVPRFSHEGVPLIRVSDLGRLRQELDRLPKIETRQAVEYRRTRVSSGDLLITVVGATIGRCDVASEEVDGFNVSRAIARVQLIPELSPHMMAAWVRGRQFRVQAELVTSGAAAQPALNMSDLAHFTIWLPETATEWADLAREVSEHEDVTNRLLGVVDAQLSLLAERRQALITAAVTGQFEVSTASGRNVVDGVAS